VGLEFAEALRDARQRIEAGPRQFPVVWRDVRRAILPRFPFAVFFILEEEVPIVIAIAHLHRHPNGWQRRR